MSDEFGGIFGEAEPAEVKQAVQSISSASPAWKDFCTSTLQSFVGINTNERARAMVEKGTFYDGDHGNIFVLAVNAILRNVGDDYKKCLYQLMSMDPISTIFIYLDPFRSDDPVNGAIRSALGKLDYQSRAAANQEYKNHFAAACAAAMASNKMDALLSTKKLAGIANGSEDQITASLLNHIKNKYEEVKGSSDSRYYTCLRPALRARVFTYDFLRYQGLCLYNEVFGSTPMHEAAKMVNPSAYKGMANRIMESFMADLSGTPFQVKMVGCDKNDVLNAVHFIRSDMFIYVPMPSDVSARYMEKDAIGPEALQIEVINAMPKNKVSPLSVSVFFSLNFDNFF